MPKRLLTRALSWAGRWAAPIILFLLCLSTVMTVIAASGYTKARDAQRRVNLVEFERAAERQAADVDRVATCFRTAQIRPQLVEILEAIANQQEFAAKEAIGTLIDSYNETTPTEAKCLEIAHAVKVDPSIYLNPPD